MSSAADSRGVRQLRNDIDELRRQRVARFDNLCHPTHGGVVNVSLTKELEALVNEKVKSGRYLSASEVVRDALRLLEERDRLKDLRLADLRRDIAKGFESGPPAKLDAADLKRRARRGIAASKKR
jgi:antitoxin ParD1/3/4